MSISTRSLASREYWLGLRDDLRDGYAAVSDLLSAADGQSEHNPTVSVSLDEATAARLAEITGGEPILSWAVVVAATAVALRRFGASHRIAFLASPPGRDSLPLLLWPQPEFSFRVWLTQVRGAIAEATAHGIPDESVTDDDASEAMLKVSWTDSSPGKADVVLTTDGTRISARSAARLSIPLQHLVTGVVEVLRQGLADPGRSLADLAVLNAGTREQVLVTFNQTAELDSTRPYRELLLTQAEMRPDAVAVHDDVSSISYAELCRHAIAIARRLRAAGVGRETSVALIARRSAWFPVMAVGILFAGAAYVPVDLATPLARRAGMVRGTQALIVEDGVETSDDPPVRFDLAELRQVAESADVTIAAAHTLLGAPPGTGELAYTIFTSDSTDTPKAVCIEHGAFLNLLATRIRDYGLRPGVEIPQTAPLTLDLSIWQMFAAFTGGATVCVVPDDTVGAPSKLATLAITHRHACLAMAPTSLAMLLDELESDDEQAMRLGRSLERLISTGEVLSPALAARWHSVMPGVPLLTAYGPAETADTTTGGPVSAGEIQHTPIGRVLPNVRVYILDEDMQLVPPGVVGEIHIGGRSVGRGYLDDPALTASAFLPDPFTSLPGRRLYRTGDRGLWREDGVVVLVGHAGDQVKIRGRRVELRRIENLLENSPDVGRAAVETVGTWESARLVAFVTEAAGGWLDEAELLDFAAQRLPDHMVPHDVLVLDQLPFDTSGKIDQLALREYAIEMVSGAEFVSPRTEIEQMLCELWSTYLRTERIGVRHSFFALGGESIVAIRIAHDAKQRGITLKPREILANPTIEELARVAVRAENTRVIGVESGDDSAFESGAPLTPPQLAFLARDVPNPHHWNQSVRYDLLRTYELTDVVSAVDLLSQRHPALRTRFDLEAASPTQRTVIEPPPVTEFDLRDVPDRDVAEQVHTLATGLHESLDLRSGPVARFGLFRLAEHVPDKLVAVIHHLVVDLLSWDVITEELSALLREGDARACPKPGPSYLSWAAHLADHVRHDPARLDVAYWLERDWDRCAAVVPERVTGVEDATGGILTEFDEDWGRVFVNASRASGVTVYERLLAALGTALQQWAGLPGGDALVQLGGHGREDVLDIDLSGIVGYFSSAYPFALPLPGTSGSDAHTREVAKRYRELPGRGFDFEAARYLHPDPALRVRLAALPVPRIAFNFWGTPSYLSTSVDKHSPVVLDNVQTFNTGMDRDPGMPREVAIECYASFTADRLSISWSYSKNVLGADRIQTLADAYANALWATHRTPRSRS
ncbi:non-ribosomal peptide synthetase [Actinomadura sp. 6K520]|uniref:non-ribosomal peptide synthetase n=1 Tax=Actinomadura sp. 6K520 TaxID=2530364 RepID=UPI00104FB7FA|nr:non-ribosomal peptide synthetase [Actinomadura sp. 6K520]TDE32823.1 amino acid adenylation domain-containing protein [Actinomadura sp. 6K520]